MTDATRERLFGAGHAFDHPVTVGIVTAIVAVLVVSGLAILAIGRRGPAYAKLHAELRSRYLSWLVLVPLIAGPVLLGAFWGMIGACLLGLLAFGEFARATGLFRERLICAAAVLGVLHVHVAVLDKWYEFFMALTPLTISFIAAVALIADRPQGYIQRVATAVFGFLFFGACLGHVGYLMNTTEFRPIVLWLLLSVELSDVFGFVVGKSLGRRKLLPATSPGKTVAGAVGSLVLTTALAASIGAFLFETGPMARWLPRLAVCALIPIAAQIGDLMLSAVKRDLGLKDLGAGIPGHGGVLDRFDSLVLAAPVIFQVGSALGAWEFDAAKRIFSG